ncbi:MAG: TonB-dependent receptor [Bacteroidales bacterium]|nr:TonB-dependent receptor [Bacteroidales bacterium]
MVTKHTLARFLVTIPLLLMLSVLGFAQTQKVVASGVIVDEEGLPVIGAAVLLPETPTKGTVTDVDGRFSLEVPKGATLVATSTGYEDIRFTAGQNLKLKMKFSVTMLNETVVVGYGVQRRESVVGAVAQIENEAIVNTGLTNVTQAMAGKLSGVVTLQSSGAPGGDDAALLVRGISSWNGSAPLVMVDGVERSFNSIDPNEVASISVLKDASATAVFGAKGANGVILVTTRGGQKGKPKLSATVAQTFKMPTMLPRHYDAYSTVSALNVAFKNSQSWSQLVSDYDLQQFKNPSSAVNSIRYPDNDWYDILLKDVANSTDANMNMSGGTDRTRYFISLGYKHDGSIFKKQKFEKTNFDYQRLNYRANLDFLITDYTTITYRVGGSIGIKNAPGTSPISAMFSSSTVSFPAYYPAWLLEQIPDWDYPNASGDRLVTPAQATWNTYYGNPYNNINLPSYSESTASNLFTDLLLKQSLDMLVPGLSLNGKFSFSTDMSRTSESVSKSLPTYYLNWNYLDAGQVNPWVSSVSGTNVVEDTPFAATQGGITSHSYSLYWEGSVNYDRTFNNHHVTAMSLINQRENKSNYSFPYRSMGLVGRLTYDYSHKYLLEFNVGYTGSEQFAPSNRFGLFPSMAAGYVISNEKWWKKAMPWWSKMKIRYSDGFVGSDSAASRWLYYSSYSKSDYIYQDSAANEVAQWEMAHKRDLGLEMGWFKNRLTAEVDLFNEHRTNMLVTPVVPLLVGVDYKQVNKGEMKKHGFEIEMKWSDKFSNGIGYYISGMYSFNENRIINFEDPPYLPDYQKVAGKPYAGQQNGVSVVDSGYYTSVDDIHNYPSYSADWSYVNVGSYKFLDYRPDGTINVNDLHSVAGSQYPSSLMSLGFGLNWKGWEFNMLFYGNYGKYANYNANYELDFVKGDVRLNESMADFWSPTNPNAQHASLVYNGSAGHPMYSWPGIVAGQTTAMGLVGRTWRQVDYINLRDLYLGYTFGKDALRSKVGINSLTLYLTGNNLFYFTDLVSGNPELTSFTTGAYPLMKTLKFGLKVGF